MLGPPLIVYTANFDFGGKIIAHVVCCVRPCPHDVCENWEVFFFFFWKDIGKGLGKVLLLEGKA